MTRAWTRSETGDFRRQRRMLLALLAKPVLVLLARIILLRLILPCLRGKRSKAVALVEERQLGQRRR